MVDALPPYMGTKPTPGRARSATTSTKTVAAKAPSGSREFNAAFREARSAGKERFQFGGKAYTTELAKPKTSTVTTKTISAATPGPKKLVTLDRQGQLQPAAGTPRDLAKARSYFDRPAPTEAAKARARAALERPTEAEKEKVKQRIVTGLNIASLAAPLGAGIRAASLGLKAGKAARAAQVAAQGGVPAAARTAAAKAIVPAAVKANAQTASKTVAKGSKKTASKTVASKTVASKTAGGSTTASKTATSGFPAGTKPTLKVYDVTPTKPPASVGQQATTGIKPTPKVRGKKTKLVQETRFGRPVHMGQRNPKGVTLTSDKAASVAMAAGHKVSPGLARSAQAREMGTTLAGMTPQSVPLPKKLVGIGKSTVAKRNRNAAGRGR